MKNGTFATKCRNNLSANLFTIKSVIEVIEAFYSSFFLSIDKRTANFASIALTPIIVAFICSTQYAKISAHILSKRRPSFNKVIFSLISEVFPISTEKVAFSNTSPVSFEFVVETLRKEIISLEKPESGLLSDRRIFTKFVADLIQKIDRLRDCGCDELLVNEFVDLLLETNSIISPNSTDLKPIENFFLDSQLPCFPLGQRRIYRSKISSVYFSSGDSVPEKGSFIIHAVFFNRTFVDYGYGEYEHSTPSWDSVITNFGSVWSAPIWDEFFKSFTADSVKAHFGTELKSIELENLTNPK